jgi:ssDNA-binding replication factor A large subunit
MFGLSYEDIVERIIKEKKISREELEEKIGEKISQLSDLISREGAAQIVANQMGIRLGEGLGDKKFKINEIPKGVSSVNAVGKVVQIYDVREFNKNGRAGKVCNLVIGDETGTVRIVVWEGRIISEIEEGNFKEGDILSVRNAYSRVNNGRNELHLGTKAQIEVNPKGVKIGEVQNRVVERPASEVLKIDTLKEGLFAELRGTVVQLFEPRHYLACPECNKKVLSEGSGYTCKAHGAVTPRKSAIVNIFFDDGTNNIRVVCFSNQAEQLLGCKNDEIAEASSEKFEEFKKDVLGKQLAINGRVTKNTMMDRLEFMSSNIKELDPVEMIKV